MAIGQSTHLSVGTLSAICELPRVPANLRLFGSDRIGSDHVLFGHFIALSQWSLHRFVGMLERNRSSGRTASPLSHAALQHS